jgi:DNA invertase Pin-like site-specific DNA recombinase
MAKDLEDNKTCELICSHHAYLRVSTDAQDVDNQRHGILEYANSNGFTNLQFTEDSVSGKTHWRERKLGELIDSLSAGDVLIFAEISRIARNTLQVLEVLEHCVARSIVVHIAKQKMALDGSMQSRITSTVLGLAAEIEREFISIRTREALAKRKAEGVKLGRPKGPASRLHLDEHDVAIRGYLSKGISKRDIARLLPCAPSTLYDWMDRRGIRAKGSVSP